MRKKKFLQCVVVLIIAILSVFSVILSACDGKETSSEKTLKSIAVTTLPTKTTYIEDETLDLTGMVVTATFTTGQEVVTDYTVNLAGKKLQTTNKMFYVSYKYKDVTKTASVNITVTGEELPERTIVKYQDSQMLAGEFEVKYPYDVVTSSTADLVFYTYYDSTTMLVDGALELNYGDTQTAGTFTYYEITEVNDALYVCPKGGQISGTFVISGDNLTLYCTLIEVMSATTKFDNATKETATIVRDEGEIVGLYFGSMADKHFGWTKSDISAFKASLATEHDYNVYDVYMQRITENVFPEGMTSYWSNTGSIASIEIAESSAQRTNYYVGQRIDTTNLKILVTDGEGNSEVVESGFTCLPEIMTAETEKITVNYQGATTDYAVNVTVASAGTLVRIDVENAPKLLVLTSSITTLHEAVEARDYNMVVSGVYSDGEGGLYSRTVKDYKIEKVSEDDVPVTGYNQAYTISYGIRYLTITNVTICTLTPVDIVRYSQADYAFFTSYDCTSFQTNGAMELYKETEESGTFTYFEQVTSSKSIRLSGTYAISENTITFTTTDIQQTGTSKGSTGTQTAGIVRDGDGGIVGLSFGSQSGSNKVFGYGKSNVSDFKASLAELFSGEKDDVYMAAAEALDFSDDAVKANIYYSSLLTSSPYLTIEVSKLTIDATDAVTEYFVNGTFSPNGLKVTATIGDEDVLLNLRVCEISLPEMTVAGQKTITVSYMGVSETYEINVVEPKIVAIEADASEMRAYAVGEEASAEGLKVYAVYEDGSRVLLSEGYAVDTYTFVDSDAEAGEKELTVTYTVDGYDQPFTATFTVTVTSTSAVLQSIEIDTENVTKTFVYGTEFSYEGLVVTAKFDLYEKVLTSGYEVTGYVATQIGVQTITVSYTAGGETKTADYQITVTNPVISVNVENAPTAYACAYEISTEGGTAAAVGTKTLQQLLDGAGITIKAVYANGSEKDINEWTVADGATLLTPSVTSYTINFNVDGEAQSKTIDITVRIITPYELAKTSEADYVFYTYFTKDSNKLDGTLELFKGEIEDSGTYRYTAQMGANAGKYNIIEGTYKIEESTITFSFTGFVQVNGSSSMTTMKEGDEYTATVVKTESKITALNFGEFASDNKQETFWGYHIAAKNKTTVTASAAALAELDLYIGYMVCIENGEMKYGDTDITATYATNN